MRYPSQCVRQVADYKHIFTEKSQPFYRDSIMMWASNYAPPELQWTCDSMTSMTQFINIGGSGTNRLQSP